MESFDPSKTTAGVIFLGTPHRGTVTYTVNGALAEVRRKFIDMNDNIKEETLLLRDLEPDVEGLLLRTANDFLKICQEGRKVTIDVFCFYETRISSHGKQFGSANVQVKTQNWLMK